MIKIGLVAGLALMAGCATPYQQSGFAGGFSETWYSPTQFSVSFRGNGFTAGERVTDFTLLRAAELSEQAGCTHFAVKGASDISATSVYVSPSTTTTNVNAYAIGNTIYGTANTYTNPGFVTPINHPGAQATVECYHSAEPGAFDVAFVQQSIRSKYRMGAATPTATASTVEPAPAAVYMNTVEQPSQKSPKVVTKRPGQR